MNRLVTVAGMAVLVAGAISWAALAWAQPGAGGVTPGGLPVVELPGANPVAAPAPAGPSGVPTVLPSALPMPAPSPVLPGAAPTPPANPPVLPVGPLQPAPAPAAPAGPAPVGPLSPAAPAGAPGRPVPVDPAAAATGTATEEHAPETAVAPDNLAARQEPAVSLEWVGPATAKVGAACPYGLVVRNACSIPVQEVLVRVRVPAGLTCTDTEPRAHVEKNILVWDLGTLQARQEKTLQLKLLAEQKGDVSPQAWVTFTGSSVMRIKVREPKLAIKAQTPPRVLLGEPATLILAVHNPGDGAAEQVKIHAHLSEGLENARGPKLDFDLGNLAAGETRNVTIQCIAKSGGAQKCDVVAEADGGLNAKETAQLSVTSPRLELQMTGPGLRYLGRKALYTLKVSNPGDAPASNVTISDLVPDGFKVLAASDGGRHDFTTRTVSWFLGEVGPGQSHEVKLEVQAVNPGAFKHKAGAVAARGLTAESELTTRVEGLSALMLEMVDTDDPIEVGSDTAYEVRITNTGSKVETDIKLVATVPDKMEFKNATGPVRYHEEGKTILFAPIEKLAPKAEAVFRINVKALQAGTVNFNLQMTSTNLTDPVIKMEATRIYSDAPEVRSSH